MSELKSGGSEGLPVPALLVTSVVLLLNENNITDMEIVLMNVTL